MKLLVGLGNPGASYARNRHNVGFMAVEAIADGHGFGPWRGKFSGEIAEGRLGPGKALLLKPQTYMNLSGDAVQAAAAFYRLEPADIIVLHDELDLPPGRVRMKAGGGHAGHNGLRSIIARIGPDFERVRIGIGHPGDKRLVTPYVLGDFAKDEAEMLDDLLRGIARGAPCLAAGDGNGFLEAVAGARPAQTPAQTPAAARAAPPAAPESRGEAPRTALQRLADRFR